MKNWRWKGPVEFRCMASSSPVGLVIFVPYKIRPKREIQVKVRFLDYWIWWFQRIPENRGRFCFQKKCHGESEL